MRDRLALGVMGERAAAGRDYPVVCITAGVGNGLRYGAAALRESLPLWEGASVFVDHAGLADVGRAGLRSVRDLAGVLHDVGWSEEAQGIRGRIRFLGSAGWLCRVVDECLALQQAGQPMPRLGLSADLEIDRRGQEVTRIRRVHSLDVVMNPARGGEIASWESDEDDRTGERSRMNEQGIDVGKVAEQDAGLEDAELVLGAPKPERVRAAEVAEAPAGAVGELLREARAALLEARLASSRLPDPFRGQIRARLQGREFAARELEGEVAAAEQVYAGLLEAGTVQHLGAARVSDPGDRLQLALDRLMGVPIPDSASDIPRLSGIRELYLMATGDYDMKGVAYPERARLANMTTATLTSLVKNALNKALVHAYELAPFWWKPIVWEEDLASLNDVTWITLGGFADLPTVAEGADYAELSSPSDIEEVTPFVKKGGYAAITMEMIDRDDVQGIRAIPRKLGLAANRTLSEAVAAVFTANAGVGPTLDQDSTALFHADHGNLGAAALSTATWSAAIVAMYKQAEPVSGKRLGLRPRYLVVPIDLEKTAHEIMVSREIVATGSTDATYLNANVLHGTAQVVVCPGMTDTDDWAAVADPREAPGICVGYRFGRAPELFISSDPLTGSMFTSDVMRLKVRFLYNVGIGEYRALYKANVA